MDLESKSPQEARWHIFQSEIPSIPIFMHNFTVTWVLSQL